MCKCTLTLLSPSLYFCILVFGVLHLHILSKYWPCHIEWWSCTLSLPVTIWVNSIFTQIFGIVFIFMYFQLGCGQCWSKSGAASTSSLRVNILLRTTDNNCFLAAWFLSMSSLRFPPSSSLRFPLARHFPDLPGCIQTSLSHNRMHREQILRRKFVNLYRNDYIN